MNLIQLACRRLSAKGWQLRHVAGDAPCLIETQRLGDCTIALIGVTADIGKRLSFRVHKPPSRASTVHGGGKRLINGLDRAIIDSHLAAEQSAVSRQLSIVQSANDGEAGLLDVAMAEYVQGP